MPESARYGKVSISELEAERVHRPAHVQLRGRCHDQSLTVGFVLGVLCLLVVSFAFGLATGHSPLEFFGLRNSTASASAVKIRPQSHSKLSPSLGLAKEDDDLDGEDEERARMDDEDDADGEVKHEDEASLHQVIIDESWVPCECGVNDTGGPNAGGSQVPIVYVYFHGAPERFNKSGAPCIAKWKDQNAPRWNRKEARFVTRTTPRQCPLEHVYVALAVSAYQTSNVVVITDIRFRSCFQEALPADVFAKLRVVDYLCYVRESFWQFDSWYATAQAVHYIHGYAEPWEKLNYLNYFIAHTWMKDNDVPLVAYAEADVAVLIPPALPTGCDSVSTWDFAANNGKFYWAAMTNLGCPISADLLGDFLNFVNQIYSDSKYLRILIVKIHRSSPWQSQMNLWYLYAMASRDREGKPWSKKKPWPTDNDTVDLVLPETREFRLCNGYYPIDGKVYDNMHAYRGKQSKHTWTKGKMKFTIELRKGKIVARMDGVLLYNLHFQGGAKSDMVDVFGPLLPFRLQPPAPGG